MLEILKTGLETSVQELPGRIGHWERGIPPSGPADPWSFRLANLLVGNSRDTAALEWQFIGPSLRFHIDGAFALAGADMPARLDDELVPAWQTVHVRAGQVLACGAARIGARGYIAVSGGLRTPQVLGSRATFHMAGIGGMSNGAVKVGERLPVGEPSPFRSMRVAVTALPPIDSRQRSGTVDERIAAMLGPNDSWLDCSAIDTFFASEWTVQTQSSRTGLRLSGPQFTFSDRATRKRPEHGGDPSNILDHGYPVGAVSIAGQTPIVLMHDAPSAGGFIVPFTVPSGDLWRLGQARPAEKLRFRRVSFDDANDLRSRLDALCTRESLVELRPSA